MPRKPKDADKLYGFGDRIRRLRKRAGLTQAELANEIGATKQSISWWEQDVARNQRYECSNCSAIALYRVSKVLDTTMEYLIAGEGRSLPLRHSQTLGRVRRRDQYTPRRDLRRAGEDTQWRGPSNKR